MWPKKIHVKFAQGDESELIQLAEGVFCCPVCGSDRVDLPYASNGSASFEICPSCGIEFGVDDQIYDQDVDAGITHEVKWKKLRGEWLKKIKPTAGILGQLKNIGEEMPGI